MLPVNKPLAELFRAHGIQAELQEGWVTFPGRPHRAHAALFNETETKSGVSLQLDVRLEIGPERMIVESFSGVGDSRESAARNAFQSFAANTFHVLVAVFFASDCTHVTREEWVLGGRNCRVTNGGVGVKGRPPVDGEGLFEWYRHFEAKIREQRLSPGTHWIRLFFGQYQGKPLACEVLLDNQKSPELQSEMAAFAWPAGQEFYSVRIFLVLQVAEPAAPPAGPWWRRWN